MQQVNIVKAIRKEITENMMKKFTIEQLAKEHGIAPTTLKKCFKAYTVVPCRNILKSTVW